MVEKDIKIYRPGEDGPGFKRISGEVFSGRQGKVPFEDNGRTIWVTLKVYKRLVGIGASGAGDLPLSVEPRGLGPIEISGED